MKNASSSKASKTDWKRVKSMKDRDVKITPDHPELDIKHIARVIVRKGLKPVEAKNSSPFAWMRRCSRGFRLKGPVTKRASTPY